MGFVLYIISSLLKFFLSFFFYLYGFCKSIKNIDEFNFWNKRIAVAKDRYGNGAGKYFFNDVLLTKNSKHKFGNINETISSVIGKNKRDGTLSWAGIKLDWFLNILEPNHSMKSIDDAVREDKLLGE